MCEPVTISMMVIAALAAVQQQKATNAQAKAQYQNLHVAALQNNARTMAAGEQIRSEAAGQMFDAAREAEKGRSAAITAAGEAGITGNTVTAILGESFFNQGLSMGRIQQNARNAMQNLMFGNADVRTNIQSGINQVQTVSGMEVAGQIAGSVLSNPDAFRTPNKGVSAQPVGGDDNMF